MQNHVHIFLSCVSNEFKSYRDALRNDLDRPNVTVKTQEQFVPTGTDTLDKLDDYIRQCDAVIHLVGDMTGASPRESGVLAFRARYPDLEARIPQLKDLLEPSKTPLSYTQWEAYLALYHGKVCIIAVPDITAKRDPEYKLDDAQRALQTAHLERLRAAGRYPEITFANADRLSIQVLRSKLHDILAKLPSEQLAQHRRSRFGENQFDELKDLLLNDAPTLRKENFLCAAFVQITNSIEMHYDSSRKVDSVLMDRLAERESSHELLMFAYLCMERARVLGLESLKTRLNRWLSSALKSCELTLAMVKGHECCQDALDSLDVSSPPAPYVEVAWKSSPTDPQRKVFPEAYLRWGRCRTRLSHLDAKAMSAKDVVADVVDRAERQHRAVPLSRIDVFTSLDELNCPWEYRRGFNSADENPQLHPWPTVVRLQRKDWERRNLKAPPLKLGRRDVACMLGEGDAFLKDTRTHGAFFAAWYDCECIDLKTLSQAVSWSAVGLWLRSSQPVASAGKLFDELEGLLLSELPRRVHDRRRTAQKGSEWRDVSVLYDPPELPSFEFSDDCYSIEDEIRTSAGLT